MLYNDTGKEIECLCIEKGYMIVQCIDIRLPVVIVVPSNGDQERCGGEEKAKTSAFLSPRWLRSREIGLR